MIAAATPEDSETVERQAIAWLVRLQAQPVNARLQSACARWRAADPAHEQAWQAVHLARSMTIPQRGIVLLPQLR